jgi:hypothetical protein
MAQQRNFKELLLPPPMPEGVRASPLPPPENRERCIVDALEEMMATLAPLERHFYEIFIKNTCRSKAEATSLPVHVFQLPEFFSGWGDKRLKVDNGGFYVIDEDDYQGILLYRHGNLFFIHGFPEFFSLLDSDRAAVLSRISVSYHERHGKKLSYLRGPGQFCQKIVVAICKALHADPAANEVTRNSIVSKIRRDIDALASVADEQQLARQWNNIWSSPLQYAIVEAEKEYDQLMEELNIAALTAVGLAGFTTINLQNLKTIFQEEIAGIFDIDVVAVLEEMSAAKTKDPEEFLVQLFQEQSQKRPAGDAEALMIFGPRVIGIFQMADSILQVRGSEPASTQEVQLTTTFDQLSRWLAIQRAMAVFKNPLPEKSGVQELSLDIFAGLDFSVLMVIRTKMDQIETILRNAQADPDPQTNPKKEKSISKGLYSILHNELKRIQNALP